MLSPEEIQRYRTMPLEVKLREFELLMDAAFEVLEGLPQEERRRRWALWEADDESNARALAEKLASYRESTEGISHHTR